MDSQRRGWGKLGSAAGVSVSYKPTQSTNTPPKPSPIPGAAKKSSNRSQLPQKTQSSHQSVAPNSKAASSTSTATSKTQAEAPNARKYNGLERVISGGETGADRAGLEAAKALGIATGGTAPKGFKTERGSDRTLAEFGVIEEPSMGFSDISMMNVENSDGTVAFRVHEAAGTDRTISYCQSRFYKEKTAENIRGQSKDGGYRPVLVITNVEESHMAGNVKSIEDFILRNRIRVLNVAGHRESTSGVKGFQQVVIRILENAFKSVMVGALSEEQLRERLTSLDGGAARSDDEFQRKKIRVRPFVVHSKKQKYDVYVGRPSDWGNPFKIGPDGDREDVCASFDEWAREDPDYIAKIKVELKGKVLGCFCAPLKCHAETLAYIANFE